MWTMTKESDFSKNAKKWNNLTEGVWGKGAVLSN